tara:strand:+ start:662 stop:859 length:198 start_codon:yes stop_codon:yes gene_type:complete
MFTEEQSKALLQDMVTIYNKIDADIDNLKDKQSLFANLIQGCNSIVNPTPPEDVDSQKDDVKKKK